MPFDRLIQTVDRWAEAQQRTDVFAQIGSEGREPSFIPWVRRMEPVEFQRRLKSATFIVAHAGMGTILSALMSGKPLLVMPRRGDLMETRNDHQIATAKHLSAAGHLTAAFTEVDLTDRLNKLGELTCGHRIDSFASPALIHALRTFLTVE